MLHHGHFSSSLFQCSFVGSFSYFSDRSNVSLPQAAVSLTVSYSSLPAAVARQFFPFFNVLFQRHTQYCSSLSSGHWQIPFGAAVAGSYLTKGSFCGPPTEANHTVPLLPKSSHINSIHALCMYSRIRGAVVVTLKTYKMLYEKQV